MDVEIFEIIEKNFNLFIPGAIFGTFFGAFLKFLFDRMNQKAYFRNEYYKRLTEEMMQALKALDEYLYIVSKSMIDVNDSGVRYNVIYDDKDFQKFTSNYSNIMQNLTFLSENIMKEIRSLNKLIMYRTHPDCKDKEKYSKEKAEEIKKLIEKIYKEKNLLLYESKNIKKYLKNEIDFKYKFDKYRIGFKQFVSLRYNISKFIDKIIYKNIEKEELKDNDEGGRS